MNRLSKQEGHISTCQLKREINDKEEEAVIHELHKPIKGMIATRIFRRVYKKGIGEPGLSLEQDQYGGMWNSFCRKR
jgi:hypothetical protein